MKVVVQRVLRAKVSVNGHEINSITQGLCLLVGLQKTDEKNDIDTMVQKILKLRLFDHNEKKWHCNVIDMNYEILSISQFTLCYKLKGNKLDFHMAMPGNLAQQNYQYFLDTLRKHYNDSKIKDPVTNGHTQRIDGLWRPLRLKIVKCTCDANSRITSMMEHLENKWKLKL